MKYKPGYKTTELYMTTLMYISLFVVLYMVGTDMLTEDLAKWLLPILAGAAGWTTREYTRSRGLVKAISDGEN